MAYDVHEWIEVVLIDSMLGGHENMACRIPEMTKLIKQRIHSP